MKRITRVRAFVWKRKLKHVIVAELATLIALCFGVIAANVNYIQVQAAEVHTDGFYEVQTTQLQGVQTTAVASTTEAVAVREQQVAAEKRAELVKNVVAFAVQYQGYNYVLGGREMSKVRGKGLDCAGFVNYVFTKGPAGKNWTSMNVTGLYNEIGGTHVSVNEMEPGDIIFFSRKSHIAIYIGDGKIVHAMDPRHGIVVMDLYRANGRTYSGKAIIDVRRVL